MTRWAVDRWRRRSVAARCVVLAIAAGGLPVLAVLGRFVAGTVTLDGDEAVIALQVRDAATGGFPLLGLYSRYGWNHPGPIAFYLLAPFQLFGPTWGLLIGTAVWQLAALGIAAWLASRRGGTGLVALVVAAQCATWLSIGGAAVIDPWTPILAAVLLVPLLVAAWGAMLGDRAALGALVILGSIVTQVHIGYAVFVVTLGIGVLIVARDRRALPVDRSLQIAVAVALAAWVPVAVGELTGRTDNFAALWHYFRDESIPTAG